MKTLIEKPFEKVILICIIIFLVSPFPGCVSDSVANPLQAAVTNAGIVDATQAVSIPEKGLTVLTRPQVPILCYHQIRNWQPSDSKRAKDYIVPVSDFCAQIKLLADNGYHTILPDQLFDYLTKGAPLPSRPVMITFDDSREEQFTIASTELSKYGFKGVYFIMTVSLGRPNYMTREQVKILADAGNVIGSHTWNHSNVRKYVDEDWSKQIDKPSEQLEKITGKPINYFAYPFGLWDKQAIQHLKQRDFKAAFQLSAKRDEQDPQFTIRRMIVPGDWNTATFQKWIGINF